VAEYDIGFKIVARLAGPALPRLAGIAVQEWAPVADTVQTTERLADRAFLAENAGQRFVVYIEAYTYWVESAMWSVLAKSGLISERERLPTRSLIFILMPKGYRPQAGTFRLEAVNEPTQQIWFREVCLWQQPPEPWWEQVPGLMPLYPLCKHGTSVLDAVQHAATAIRHHEMDHSKRTDLLTILAVFGKLKSPTLEIESIIRREEMRDSPLVQEWLDEGGLLQARTDVLELVELRFGKKARQEFAPLLERIAIREQLQALHRLAATTRRVSQFRKALAELRQE
jgi:hypothetical protein